MKDKTINDYQNRAHELALKEVWRQELKKKVEEEFDKEFTGEAKDVYDWLGLTREIKDFFINLLKD